jgi:IclR family transcriptional regulator, pca regulon regulatory protein
MKSGEVNENYIVSSLVRGFQILSAFTPNRPVLRVSEIAEMTGIDQATVYRFVYTLEKLGYLVRDEDTKRYHQSVRMLTLCLPARLGTPVREIAIPTMFELSNQIREIVNLCILDEVDTVVIATAEFQERFIFSVPIGHRSPGFCTAAGRVMLAYQSTETWDQLVSQMQLTPYTAKTIVDPALL